MGLRGALIRCGAALTALGIAACSAFWNFERPNGALDSSDGVDASLPVEGGFADRATPCDGPVCPADARPESDASFDVTDLPGLALWLEASVGAVHVGANVSAWSDGSGKQNHFAAFDPTRVPTFVPAGINGRPAVRFDAQVASCLAAPDAPTLRWGLDDFAVEIVAGYDNDPSGGEASGYGLLYGKTDPAFPYVGPAMFVNYAMPSPSTHLGGQVDVQHGIASLATMLNDGKPRLYAMRRAAGLLEVRVNGTPALLDGKPPLDAASIDVSAVGSVALIGCSKPQGGPLIQRLNGRIAEIVAVRGVLSAVDLARLEGHLRAKYALE